jgi:hypothetical protein
MSWRDRLASCYNTYKENNVKRQHFNNQINKYHLNLSQFYSLKRRLNEDEDENEKDNTEDSESTFNKLEHANKLGIKVNNENMWSVIKMATTTKRNCKKVIPIG